MTDREASPTADRRTRFVIHLSGCDDTTIFEMELTYEEYVLLLGVAELSEKASRYSCMPVMKVTPYDGSGAA